MERTMTQQPENLTFGEIDISRACKEGSKLVFFRYYHDGQLWYKTDFDEMFPVPIDDVGAATLHINQKAIMMMRYMRRWNKTCQEGKADV